MAGLWEKWEPEDGSPVFSFTILTTEAAPGIQRIHGRMPVILQAGAYEAWLDPDSGREDILPLLGPFPGEIQAHPVSTFVNSPRNDAPECIEPANSPGRSDS